MRARILAPADALKIVDVTDILLPPGDYFMGLSASSASSGIYRSSTVGYGRSLGIAQEASAHPLPAVMTPVALTTEGFAPTCGFFTTAAEL